MKLGQVLDYVVKKYPQGTEFAGVGSRKAPDEALDAAADASIYLCRRGFKLRSGAAEGMDEAFEAAWTGPPGSKQIFLPKKGFNGSKSLLYEISPEAYHVARKYHPYWHMLDDFSERAMGRNSYQVLGPSIFNRWDWSSFLFCWTKDRANGTTRLTSKASGGTGQAIRVAAAHGIPVFNFKNLEL